MSATFWPEKPSTYCERVAKELDKGLQLATQLQVLLQRPFDRGYPPSSAAADVDELVVQILRTFDGALAVISSCESPGEAVSLNQLATSSQVVDSTCSDDRGPGDSGESRKRPAVPAGKDRRGSFKRKKNSQSWTTITSTIEDGHSWRKYGQKGILNSKQPRSYFRCTRKHDQGCRATKQVQRMEDNPQMYHTTYIGHHTCTHILKVPPIIAPSPESDHHHHHHHHHHLCGEIYNNNNGEHDPSIITSTTAAAATNITTLPNVKRELCSSAKEELNTARSDLTDNVSSLDSIVWKDLMAFDDESAEFHDNYGHGGVVLSNMYPFCTEATSQSLDMAFVVDSIDFDSDIVF